MNYPATPPKRGIHELQRKLAHTLRRTADVLDQSARLADDDAERRASQHDADLEALEHRRAERARAAARKARSNAERLDS